ncbi:MAG: hypothetical protein K8S16_07130, partial [Bacteroidales bacterium]|nr:hypothetical protein [Bacteroidales bacterium]
EGTAYGNEVSFFTLQAINLPTVTTASITDILQTIATGGGDVTDNGGTTVTARGICWSLNTNPTLADDFTTDGSGTGVFISSLTSLSPDTEYFVRAYATNSDGTAYGNEVSFTSSGPCPGTPTVTDAEGNVYNTIQIGNQCWMAENLNVGIAINATNGGSNNNGDQTNNGIIEKYCYDNSTSNCATYGGLYQWDEVMQYSTTAGTQGICPAGWHIPTDDEWKVLEGTVDSLYGVGHPEWDGFGYRGFDAGMRLKSQTDWNGDDASGFNGLASGSYSKFYDSFNYMGTYGSFWTSSEYSTHAYQRYLFDNNGEVGRNHITKNDGRHVRCLKN